MEPLLIGAETLSGQLVDPTQRPTVLDVRWSLAGPEREAYLAGHVPGAVFCNLDRDLAAPAGPAGRHPLPDAVSFGAAMRRLGVSRIRTVVVYDGADSTAAARAWWCLRYFGHPHVRVLDGGWSSWVIQGLPQQVGETPITSGDFEPIAGGLPVVDASGAADVARRGFLVDVRVPARYRAEVEPIDLVAGHVPGAVNLPTGGNVDAAGRFRSVGELRRRFADAGVLTATPVAVYCGSGVTAAHTVLALALVGQPAALYAGSWSEWISDPRRSVATGPQPG